MDPAIEIVPTGRPHTFEVRLDGRPQSVVDVDDPTWLGYDYVRRMGDVVDALADPGDRLRTVHVGGAGLSLARYVEATRPRSAQVVLEPDEELTAQVRERLPLGRRTGIKVRATDGLRGTAALRDDYADLVVLDAFVDGREPPELVSATYFADVARVLDLGVLLVNVVDRPPFAHARRVVAGLATAFDAVVVGVEPATLRARREGNLLVVAGGDDRGLVALRHSATTSVTPYRVLDEAAVRDALGGGTPYPAP